VHEDILSFFTFLSDSLSFLFSVALASTLENLQIAPTTAAVRFLLMHGNAPVFQ
jgi:hypothetical protein